eukprot:13187043-Alexandrium_andersonii.AAC.1
MELPATASAAVSAYGSVGAGDGVWSAAGAGVGAGVGVGGAGAAPALVVEGRHPSAAWLSLIHI